MSKWILVPCLAGLAAAQAPPQVQPTFRVGTRLVQLDVVVLNDKTPVRDLTKDDFTVQDKGKPQTISVFSVTEAHKAPKIDPFPANVSSNRINNSGESTSNATVILFDKMNTPSADQVVARRQTLALLSTLKPTDRVAFYSLDRELTMVQDFNAGAEHLASAAKSVATQTGAQPTDPAGNAGDQALASALQNSLTAFQEGVDGSTKVAATMSAFRTIVRHLDGLPGRKTLIWLTASIPFTYGQGIERQKNDQAEIDRMERLMSEANVAVYAVDPRGAGASNVLAKTTNNNSTSGRFLGGGVDPNADSNPKRGGGQAGDIARSDDTPATTDASPNTLAGTQGLQLISDNTGGKAFYNTNDLAGALREILDTTEVTYTLGFYVDDKALDNKIHDLSVKIAKKPELAKANVRYRKSYAALNAQALAVQQARPTLAVLAGDALDASAVGIMAATAPSPKQPGLHQVQVKVDLGDLTLERKGDKWTGAFDLGLALQGSGKQPSSDVNVKTINLSLSDDQLKQGLKAGLIIDNTVPTPAQPMKLRVVVQDKVGGTAGSVRIPIGPR